MRRSFNKYGNIEIESSTSRYRIPLQELSTDDPIEIEKGIKRKIQTVEIPSDFLLPFDIKVLNRYMVLYYDLAYFSHIDYLRELDLEEKLPYFLSLISIAKEQEKGLNISWDRLNFCIDKYEKTVKVLLFETDHLEIYDKPEDLLETVKKLIVSVMTNLSIIISRPKRNDFIDPSEENIHFVENVLKLESLDDLAMYLETLSLDIEQINSNEEPKNEDAPPLKKSRFKKSEPKVKEVKKTPKKKKAVRKPSHSSSNKNKKNKMPLYAMIIVGASLVLYMLSSAITPSSGDSEKTAIENVSVNTDEETIFKSSSTVNGELVEVYRKAYNSDYKEAYKILSGIDKKKLDVRDVSMLIRIYDETNHVPELLNDLPELGNDVVTYLLTSDKLDRISQISASMEVKNPYIEFENAHYTQEFEYMLSLKDKVKINGRKESQIIDAYLSLEKVNEAKNFAAEVGNPDLIKQVEEYGN